MEALNGNPGAANPLYDLVIRADSASVDRDLKTMGVAMAGYEIGVPIERHLMDIMRRLIKEGIWQVNELGARVWNINGGIYIVWPAGGDEIAEKVRIEDIKGMPRTADGILDMLCERNLAFVREGSDRYWKIVPDVLAAKIPNKYLACIRLRDDALISSTPIATVPGKLMNAESEDEDTDQVQGPEQSASTDTTAYDVPAPTTAQQAAAVIPATESHEATPSPDAGQSTVEALPEKTYRSDETAGENNPSKAKLTVAPVTGEILGVESANPGAEKQPEIRELPKTHKWSTSGTGQCAPANTQPATPDEFTAGQSLVANISTALNIQSLIEIYRACPNEKDKNGTQVVLRKIFREAIRSEGVARWNTKQFNEFIKANSQVFWVDGLYLYCNEFAPEKDKFNNQ